MNIQRICTYCQIFTSESKVCSGCRSDHYCSRECQVVDWPRHKRLCSPQKPNRRIMKKLRIAGVRVLCSAAYTKVRKRHPLDTLTLQYVGMDLAPTIDYLEQEMQVAIQHLEFWGYPVILPSGTAGSSRSRVPPSSVIQAGFFPTIDTRRSFVDFIELKSWVGQRGHSLTAGAGFTPIP